MQDGSEERVKRTPNECGKEPVDGKPEAETAGQHEHCGIDEDRKQAQGHAVQGNCEEFEDFPEGCVEHRNGHDTEKHLEETPHGELTDRESLHEETCDRGRQDKRGNEQGPFYDKSAHQFFCQMN